MKRTGCRITLFRSLPAVIEVAYVTLDIVNDSNIKRPILAGIYYCRILLFCTLLQLNQSEIA